jgi:hypothetical protein
VFPVGRVHGPGITAPAGDGHDAVDLHVGGTADAVITCALSRIRIIERCTGGEMVAYNGEGIERPYIILSKTSCCSRAVGSARGRGEFFCDNRALTGICRCTQ